MKKAIRVLLILICLLFILYHFEKDLSSSEYYINDSGLNNCTDDGYYYQRYLGLQKLKERIQNVERNITYIVIVDTSVQKTYMSAMYNSGKSTLAKIHTYSSCAPYANESMHGTELQVMVDEMATSIGANNYIRTIQVKYKSKDDSLINFYNLVGLLNDILKYKEQGYNIRVVNMSQSIICNNESEKELLNKTIDKLYSNGILMVASAGNFIYDNNLSQEMSISDNTDLANCDKTIIVGAVDRTLSRWIDKNTNQSDYMRGSPIGEEIDIMAVGENIEIGSQLDFPLELNEGTSYSAIQVSFSIALACMVNDNLSLDIIRDTLYDTASYKSGLSEYMIYGHGVLDLEKYIVTILSLEE